MLAKASSPMISQQQQQKALLKFISYHLVAKSNRHLQSSYLAFLVLFNNDDHSFLSKMYSSLDLSVNQMWKFELLPPLHHLKCTGQCPMTKNYPAQNVYSSKISLPCSMQSHLNSRLHAKDTRFASLALMWVSDTYDTYIKFDFSYLSTSTVLQTQIILTQTCDFSSRLGSLTWYFILPNVIQQETQESSLILSFLQPMQSITIS